MRSIATGLVLVALLAVPAPSQVRPSSSPAAADTLTVSGTQIIVNVVERRPSLSSPADSSTRAAFLEAGYEPVGDVLYRQWVDPITRDTVYRIVGLSESPASVGMEGTDLDRGGLLQIECTPGGTERVLVLSDGPLRGDPGGNVRGTVRFGDRPPERADDWTVTENGRGASVPDDWIDSFYRFMMKTDTLAVRLEGGSGDPNTYLFALEDFGTANVRTVECGDV